jgi:N-acetylmuramoyl-L-alanine amidase
MARLISADILLVISVITVTSVFGSPSGRPYETPQTSRHKRPDANMRVTRLMIIEAQQRLAELGYWIEGNDGKWNAASKQGLIAFQKVEGRPRTGRLTVDELRALNGAARPLSREKGFAHIEVDLKRQVLFVVDADGTVSKILPVSTGNGKTFELEGDTLPAVTPPGRFRVYNKLPGWRKSPLGLLYYPNYIVGGIAIHGNHEVPAQPASHGCIRIPMFAAKEFSDITPIGFQVIVYSVGSVTDR